MQGWENFANHENQVCNKKLPRITCSKLTTKILEQGTKYVQS